VKAIEYRTLSRRGNDCARRQFPPSLRGRSGLLSGGCGVGWRGLQPGLLLAGYVRCEPANSCILSLGLKRKDYFFY